MDSVSENAPQLPHVGPQREVTGIEGKTVTQIIRLGASVFAVRERDGRQEWRVLRRGR